MTDKAISRRAALTALAISGAAATFPARIAHAAVQDGTAGTRNFVFVNLRGAADGLAMLMPTGDPALRTHRAALVDGALNGTDTLAGTAGAATRLDGMFTLHPALAATGRRYASGQMLAVHALASGYRDRSHFDAQNILETGGIAAYAESSGWMNRLAGVLTGEAARALAIGAVLPPVLRGPAPASSYAPSALPTANTDLIARAASLYEGDAELHGLLATALATREMAGDGAEGGPSSARNGATLGTLAANLMRPAAGGSGQSAHLIAIDIGGWDTHNNQTGRIANQLRQLDAMIEALASGLGPAWADTMVLVATEFGRTVAANGTGGTDHGTGGAAMLIGGAVAGGRVIADWPGLAQAQLHEGRDLRPTMATEALIAGAVAAHYRRDPAEMARLLYPAHGGLRGVGGLVRT